MKEEELEGEADPKRRRNKSERRFWKNKERYREREEKIRR
jgi:hypothetical protein